jgi:hypothetical protein
MFTLTSQSTITKISFLLLLILTFVGNSYAATSTVKSLFNKLPRTAATAGIYVTGATFGFLAFASSIWLVEVLDAKSRRKFDGKSLRD